MPLNRRNAEFELEVLEILEDHTEGIGSGSVLLLLLELGLQVSQPTVGRLLKLLDHRGLTRKVANKGRTLTPRGAAFLAQVRHQRQRVHSVERLIAAVQPSTLEELRGVLVARRALEHETAKLAAEHASLRQIAEMRRTVEAQRREREASGTGNGPALDFHRLLAAASGNTFLALAGDVLRTERHVLEFLMYHLGSTVGGDSYASHVRILEALTARDGASAGRAMVRHMNQYIRYVDSLLAQPKRIRFIAPSASPPSQDDVATSAPTVSALKSSR